MRKVLLAVALVAVSFIGANAQKGNNQVGVGAELGFPMGDFGDGAKTGFGASVKGLYGVGEAGQVTLTVGYSSFKMKGSSDEAKANFKILPVLAGYRHNFSGFYVEPQLGFGSYGMKAKVEGVSVSDSEGAFTWAVGGGYAVNGFDIGARYQSGTKDGENISLIGIRIGYNFTLGGGGSARK